MKPTRPPHWEAEEFYTSYYLVVGFAIGMFAAATSLLLNVVGSAIVGEHPLQLIQVYLTFPLGESALELERGITLTIGCCLYIITGMILGGPFHVLLMWLAPKGELWNRLLVATLLATPMWLVHFYLVLAWVQPALVGGNWIVETIPWWVAWSTHLVFGWTMALLAPLGRYVPYRRQTDVGTQAGPAQ